MSQFVVNSIEIYKKNASRPENNMAGTYDANTNVITVTTTDGSQADAGDYIARVNYTADGGDSCQNDFDFTIRGGGGDCSSAIVRLTPSSKTWEYGDLTTEVSFNLSSDTSDCELTIDTVELDGSISSYFIKRIENETVYIKPQEHTTVPTDGVSGNLNVKYKVNGTLRGTPATASLRRKGSVSSDDCINPNIYITPSERLWGADDNSEDIFTLTSETDCSFTMVSAFTVNDDNDIFTVTPNIGGPSVRVRPSSTTNNVNANLKMTYTYGVNGSGFALANLRKIGSSPTPTDCIEDGPSYTRRLEWGANNRSNKTAELSVGDGCDLTIVSVYNPSNYFYGEQQGTSNKISIHPNYEVNNTNYVCVNYYITDKSNPNRVKDGSVCIECVKTGATEGSSPCRLTASTTTLTWPSSAYCTEYIDEWHTSTEVGDGLQYLFIKDTGCTTCSGNPCASFSNKLAGGVSYFLSRNGANI